MSKKKKEKTQDMMECRRLRIRSSRFVRRPRVTRSASYISLPSPSSSSSSFFFIISFPFPLSLNPFTTAGLREDETCVYHLGLFKGMDGHFGSRREETGRSAVGFNLAITRRSNPSFSFTYYPSVGIQWRRSNKHNGRKGLVK